MRFLNISLTIYFVKRHRIVSQCSRETLRTFHRPPPNTRSGFFRAVQKSNSLQQPTDFYCTWWLDWHLYHAGNRFTVEFYLNVSHTGAAQLQRRGHTAFTLLTKLLFRRIFQQFLEDFLQLILAVPPGLSYLI